MSKLSKVSGLMVYLFTVVGGRCYSLFVYTIMLIVDITQPKPWEIRSMYSKVKNVYRVYAASDQGPLCLSFIHQFYTYSKTKLRIPASDQARCFGSTVYSRPIVFKR